MDKKEFDDIAKEFTDASGDIFGECSYGISFSFDLAQALSYWLSQNYAGDKSDEYAAYCVLSHAPISYAPGMGAEFLSVEEDASGEYATTRALVEAMNADKNLWRKYFDALKWFCENDKN